MGKKRVYEFAREKDLPSKTVIEKASELGIQYNSHMSSMENEDVSRLSQAFSESDQKPSQKSESKKSSSQNQTKQSNGDKKEDKHQSSNKESKKSKTAETEKDKRSKRRSNENKKRATGSQSRSTEGEATSTPRKNKRSNRSNRAFQGTHGGPRGRKRKGKNKRGNQQQPHPTPRKPRELPEVLVYSEGMTVAEIAKKLHREPAELVKKLFMMGVVANQNQSLSNEAIELLAADYGIGAEEKIEVDLTDFSTFFEEEQDEEQLTTRPPVVTVMGHVDHGKTTLLDTLRQANVIEGEAGGITQHIGAYQVDVDDKVVTFLDTPGHAAFTTMRARGADVTDIAIIVVAADDGVMPQTVEAINHAKAADVPIIVAVNKIDKPTAQPERVMQELSEYELIPEDWGGDTIFVQISALHGENVDELLEMVLLVAEVEELKANPKRRAIGSVIEARLDKTKGPIATVLVQEGTLKVGDPIVVGGTYGRVRVMVNDHGRRVKKATPSTPVEITGLNDTPNAGDQFVVFEDEKTARQVGEERAERTRQAQRKQTNTVTLDNLFESLQEGELKEVNVIVKADVQGSVEALSASLEKIEVEGVRVNIIHTGVGAINESDISLATASSAIIIGFNVRPTPQAKEMAEQENVNIRTHRVIYNAIDEIEAAMKGMLDPEYEEQVIGTLTVRETYKVSKVGTIAGCFVNSGKITRSSSVRLIRNGVVIHEGELSSLKRFKDDVREVANGYECGVTIQDYNDIKVDDEIEAYEMVEIEQ